MSLKKDIVWRVAVIYLGMLLVSILIFGRIIYLQMVQGNKYSELSAEQTLRNFLIQPNRGDILAADGRLLSSSVPYYEIRLDLNSNAMDPQLFKKNVDSLSICLSALFMDKPSWQYKRELLNAFRKKNRYYLLKRNVTYRQMKELKTFPLFRLGRYKGGLIIIQTNKRIHPQRELAARTIGYINNDDRPNIVGIEGAYDEVLRGQEGVRLMQKLSGNVWMPLKDGNEVEPKDGYDVVTTIDIDIQDVAENSLRKQLIRNNADHGTVILMEVKTGDIKAIANLERDKDGNYRELYNYAIGESIEPGSTFKLPVLVAALEDGAFSIDDTVDAGHGKIKFYDKMIRDTKEGGYGKITVKRVFEVSSNVGMSKLIMDHYADRPRELIDRLYSMRLNKKLGIDIKGEGTPMIRYPGDKYWSGISLAMISHGYEVRMTPLQILAFYNAIANDGIMVKPRFVRKLKYHGRTVKKYGVEVLNPSVCSKATLEKAHMMLEGVVENGTARNLKNNLYKIAGKTGTAQIANEKYGYRVNHKISYVASFVGYFPADDPKYSCIVVVSAPSNSVYYGNLVAGPVFREVADKVYVSSLDLQRDYLTYADHTNKAPYSKNGYLPETKYVFNKMGVHYMQDKQEEDEWVLVINRDSIVDIKSLKVMDFLVPNVAGMGLKDALYLLEKEGLQVIADGWGTVKNQSLPPGTRVRKRMTIHLEMSLK
ncbi:MAG TPA: PASTA domain-containing protein [Bacteroidetes bacterium]|nr:PASTA domain-containing protein [Bacteroidota bacterium]